MEQREKDSLIQAAKLAAINSKAFKSKFEVGCAIRVEYGTMHDYRIVKGANLEFNGHPALHAEVAALSNLFLNDCRPHDVVALCVYCPTGTHWPCYCCLQALVSHLPGTVLIIAASPEGVQEETLENLTQYAYKGRQDAT